TVSERVNTAAQGTPVVVFNPLGWARSGEVLVHVQAKAGVSANGAQVVEVRPEQNTGFADVKLHVLNVPAMGYKVVWLGGAKGAAEPAEKDVSAKDTGD